MVQKCCTFNKNRGTCKRKDGKVFSFPRRFTKKRCLTKPVRGFTMRSSCAPFKYCGAVGGAVGGGKRGVVTKLPKLRKIDYTKKKHRYKINDPFKKRKLAIHEGVDYEAKKTNKNKKKAATAKKGRFNILRIYRKNKKIKECNILTHDMRYMDKRYGLGKTKNICGVKRGGGSGRKNKTKKLALCSKNPLTGYDRSGYCNTVDGDSGNHLVCAKMDENFLNFTASKGNDLRSVVREGDNWCLCQYRYKEALDAGHAPMIVHNATNFNSMDIEVIKAIEEKSRKNKETSRKNKKNVGGRKNKKNVGGRKNKEKSRKNKKYVGGRKNKKKKKTQKQFLFNPDDPSKSFDVYIDKNPKDTIPIKYTTVKDVEDTIKKLERLFKKGAYTHKRIWQVGMILKVRLGAMLKHKKTRYKNALHVKPRYKLAERYFKFLSKRTKAKSFTERKKMTFKI